MSEQQERERREREGRARWERPTITKIGRVKDLVQGVGKISGNLDTDAGTVPKKPSGIG